MKEIWRWILWVLVIAGLVGLVFQIIEPVSNVIFLKLHGNTVIRDKATAKDVQFAIHNFISEYNDFPNLAGKPLEADIELEVAGELLDCLLGDKVAGNSREITFLNINTARQGRAGVLETAEKRILVDQWGQAFRVRLDGDHDGNVTNPDTQNADKDIRQSGSEWLRTQVAVYSLGRDGEPFTEDDITSWRG